MQKLGRYFSLLSQLTVECRGLNPILNPLFIYYSDAANLEFVSLFTDVSQIQSIEASEAALVVGSVTIYWVQSEESPNELILVLFSGPHSCIPHNMDFEGFEQVHLECSSKNILQDSILHFTAKQHKHQN